jgi:hypothetical protein
MADKSPVLSYRHRHARIARPPSDLPALLVIVLVSLALLPLMLWALYPIAKRLSIGQDVQVNLPVPGGDPHLRLSLWSDGDFGAQPRFDCGLVRVQHESLWADIDIDVATLTCQLVIDEVPSPARALDGQAMHDFYIAAAPRIGYTPTRQQSQTDADAVIAAIRGFSPDRLPPDHTHDWRDQVPGVRYEVAGHHITIVDEIDLYVWLPWYTVYCLPIWLAISAVFGCWFLRLYRHLGRKIAVG